MAMGAIKRHFDDGCYQEVLLRAEHEHMETACVFLNANAAGWVITDIAGW